MFDLTTTSMWVGAPAGIVRAETEFARWGLRRDRDVRFMFFDPESRRFRHLERAIAERLISSNAFVDVLPVADPRRSRKRKTDRIPGAIKPLAMWLLQSRRMTLRALERLRLTTRSAAIASLANFIQCAIITEKYRSMIGPDGNRRDCFPPDMALGPPVEFQANDTIVCAGAGWAHHDVNCVADIGKSSGCRLVLLWYDIIPLLSPAYFKAVDVERYRAYFDAVVPFADLVVCISHTTEKDVRDYCAEKGLKLGATTVCTLGADGSAACPAAKLPGGLVPGHYALLVGTIEPRKGHRLVHKVWKELLGSGIPQQAGFKLVCVGREGWMSDDLMPDLRLTAEQGSLLLLHDVDDADLAALYANAAFCLLPSSYEGLGLPAIEAFFHGKAILASSGGALPEVVRDFSPCLDPTDVDAWRATLERWIVDPAVRLPYEARIRAAFRHPGWAESAAMFFSVVDRVGCDTANSIVADFDSAP
jgi:glycosyltransferase involved in cell wall biosynthesis